MRPYKILIVDDDADDREFFIETFHRIGMRQVGTAGSAPEAIALLEAITNDKDLPKLIITDLNMPRVSGLELLGVLKAMLRYCRIPVIVCSTSGSALDAEQCLSSGATEYITKPAAVSDYEALTRKMRRLASPGDFKTSFNGSEC